MPGRTGVVVAGRFLLIEQAGPGGLGRVWRAHDEFLDRTVAAKEVPLPAVPPAQRAASLDRAMRAARAAARLDHPGLVTIYDVTVFEQAPWIVMRFVAGPSLDAEAARLGRLPWRRAARLGAQVADALGYAHAAGLVHGGLRPDSVLLDGPSGDRALVTGFGIAPVGDTATESAGTALAGDGAHSTGPRPAPWDYLAPEQVDQGAVGPPADLWALGAILYRAVEGHPPFDAGTPAASRTVTVTRPLPPPAHAGPLAALLAALLARDPADRPDAASAAAALARLADEPEGGPPPRPSHPGAAAPPPDPLAGPSPAPAAARPTGLGGLAGLPGLSGLAGPGRSSSRLLAGAVIAAVMVAVLILVVTLFAPGHRKSPAVTSASPAGTLLDPGGYRTQEVAFSPDGKTVAATVQGAGPDDGRLDLWTSSSGQPSAMLTSPAGGAVRGLAFSPASATALAVAGTGGIDLWNLATRQVSRHPDPSGQAAAGVAYAPGAGTVAELSAGGGIYRLALPAGSWLPGLLPGAGPVSAGQLGYSPDGTLLAAAGPAGTVRVWKVSGGSPAVLAGAVTGPFAQVAAFSLDSKTLAVAGSGGQVRLWDTASGTFSSPLTEPGRRPQAVAFSPNGATLAVGDHDGAVYLWNLASRTETVISTPGLSAGGVTSLAFSPDGKVLAVAGDTAARVYLYSLSYAGS